MAEENKKQDEKEKVEKKIDKEIVEAEKEIAEEITKIEDKVSEHKLSQKEADKKIEEEVSEEVKEIKEEVKKEEKEAGKKKAEEKKPKKKEAVVYGKDLPIPTKHAKALCNFIRGKTVEEAMSLLVEVLQFKRAVPMVGELPHRRGKGMERGRYPIKATQQFVKLLKQLAANATVNELELEKVRIECKADRAARPYRRFGDKRFKRSHVTLKLMIKKRKLKKKKINKTKKSKNEN